MHESDKPKFIPYYRVFTQDQGGSGSRLVSISPLAAALNWPAIPKSRAARLIPDRRYSFPVPHARRGVKFQAIDVPEANISAIEALPQGWPESASRCGGV